MNELPTMHELRRKHRDEVDALLMEAVRRCDWNRSRAADLIGMDRSALVKLMRKHGLPLPEGKPGRPVAAE